MKRLYFILLLLSALLLFSCQKEQMFNITTSVSPEGAGTVSPSSMEAQEGSTLSFTATPGGEYVFTGWSGCISTSDNPVTITVTSDMNVRANFTLRSYPLSLSCEGEGKIAEKILSTKSEYISGTVVELTAQPSQYWQFSHWEGDLNGTENPIQITVSSAKSVKAVFTKKSYDYNLKIVGPGAVDEEIVQNTKATLEAGTIVRLTAHPMPGAVFKGWSGSIGGADNVIEVNIDETKNVVATFGSPSIVKSYPLPDLKQPSITLKRFYPDYFSNHLTNWCGHLLTCDYNLDGYPDVITTFAAETENCFIEFYLGSQDGTLKPDPLNNNKFAKSIGSRKTIYGDYNNDDIPDICIFSHSEVLRKSVPLILLSQPSGIFKEIRFEELPGYYHAGTAGDVDNDGDVDILYVDADYDNSFCLINDGYGNFKPDFNFLPKEGLSSKYTADLYDIDKDGYLDLIWGPYIYPTGECEIIWGNGKNYSSNNKTTILPDNFYHCGCPLDFDFYDLNNDGTVEIIITGVDDYDELYFQVIDNSSGEFKDVTTNYFEIGSFYKPNTEAIHQINFEETDGRVFLTARMDNSYKKLQTVKLFELLNGKLVSLKYDSYSDYYINHSFPLYHDGIFVESIYNTWPMSEYIDKGIDLYSTNDPYAGMYCIAYNKPYSELHNIFYIDSQHGSFYDADFEKFALNGYSLEFAIRTQDPTLVIDFIIPSTAPSPEFYCTYLSTYKLDKTTADGNWHIVRIPLESFVCDDVFKEQSYWHSITSVEFKVINSSGQDFYLDEIRIRKAL